MSGCHNTEHKSSCSCSWHFDGMQKILTSYPGCEGCSCNKIFTISSNDKPVSPMVEQIQRLEERINKIESDKVSCNVTSNLNSKIDRNYSLLCERIEKLEQYYSDWKKMPKFNLKELIDMNNEYKNKIENLEKRIEEISGFCHRNWKHNHQPHKCPVCEGLGLRNDKSKVFVDSACKSCEGKGIIWG